MSNKPLLSNAGLTLVEITIALLVLLLVTLALMQTALLSIGYNMNNVLRDEAAGVADMRMDDVKGRAFAALSTYAEPTIPTADHDLCPSVPDPATGVVGVFPATGVVIKRDLKNVMNYPFCTNALVSPLDANTMRITVTVGWTWKGENFNHVYTSLVRQL